MKRTRKRNDEEEVDPACRDDVAPELHTKGQRSWTIWLGNASVGRTGQKGVLLT